MKENGKSSQHKGIMKLLKAYFKTELHFLTPSKNIANKTAGCPQHSKNPQQNKKGGGE